MPRDIFDLSKHKSTEEGDRAREVREARENRELAASRAAAGIYGPNTNASAKSDAITTAREVIAKQTVKLEKEKEVRREEVSKKSLEDLKRELNAAQDLAKRLSGEDEKGKKDGGKEDGGKEDGATVDMYSDVYDERSAGEDLSDQDFLKYITTNPDLREHIEALGLTGDEAADWGRWHWYNHGKAEMAEGRRLTRNAPGDIQNEALARQKWELGEMPKVYADLGLKSLEDILGWGLKQMTPSELWEARAKLGDDWNLLNFNPEGWRFEADNPYRKGLLAGNINVDENVGQLLSEGDKQFIQDRYNDAFIRNDFPEDWVTGNKWTGPPALSGYWNTLTNSYRNEAGDLRAPWDVPDSGWGDFVPPIGLGPRGTTGIGGSVYAPGMSREYLATPYQRPDLRDLSHLAPPPAPGLLGSSQAQKALLSGGLEAWQPEALGGVFDYKPRGATTMSPAAWVPPVIDPVNNIINNNNNNNTNTNNNANNTWNIPVDFLNTQGTAGGYNPNSVIDPFSQWSMWMHNKNTAANTANNTTNQLSLPSEQVNMNSVQLSADQKAAAMHNHYLGIPSIQGAYYPLYEGWAGRQALAPTATTATNLFDTGTIAQIYGAEPTR